MTETMKTPRPLWRLWRLVNEPRAITLLVFFGYVVLLWGGWSAFHEPPRTVENAAGELAMTWLSIMFASGGILGAVTCLPGWNWLERGGVLLIAAAALIYLGLVIYLGATGSGNRDLQIALILFALLMIIGRGVWIWNRPFAKRRDRDIAAD